MKKEYKHNHLQLQKPQPQHQTNTRSTKTPQQTSNASGITKISYSPNPSAQRYVSPLYSANNNLIGASTVKSQARKQKQNPQTTGGFQTNSFASKRLSCPKSTYKHPGKLIDQSYNQSTGSKASTKNQFQCYSNFMIMIDQCIESHQFAKLMKQQKDMEKQGIKKNLSVNSMEPQQQQNSLQAHQAAPHMMLNISQNMNNNINTHHTHDANTQILFQSDPQQVRTVIGLPSKRQNSASIIDQQPQYKTQVDPNKQKTSKPYSNGSSSLLDGHMSYENSMVQAVKNAELKHRDQSFDKINKKKKKKPKSSFTNNAYCGVKKGKQSSSMTECVRCIKPFRGQSGSMSSSPKQSSAKYGNRDSSRVISSNNPTSTHSNSSYHQSKLGLSNQKRSFQKMSQDQLRSQDQNTITVKNNSHNVSSSGNDKLLLEQLDGALTRDLKDKSSSHKVVICSKVWAEIIRREDPIIASLLTKIKQAYESHIKVQNKVVVQKQKEIDFEQELKNERVERKNAEAKIEGLSQELKKQQQCMEKQETVILEMKKQIQAYRKELIDLSTSKKHQIHKKGHLQRDVSKVPKLDLSKVPRESDDSDSDEEGKSHDKDDKDVTYQQYLKFLENESHFEDLGEQSQESLMRQEELKQRKNKIIQLLNGEISDEEEGMEAVDQSSDNYVNDIDEEFNGEFNGDESNSDIDLINNNKRLKDSNLKQKHHMVKQGKANQEQQLMREPVRDFNSEINEDEKKGKGAQSKSFS